MKVLRARDGAIGKGQHAGSVWTWENQSFLWQAGFNTMSYLYTRKNYDILMGKPNIGRYVKKQLSVTSSDLHDQRGKWEEAGMKLPAPLAAFHIGKPSLCTFWNHAKGAGCKREKDGKKV